ENRENGTNTALETKRMRTARELLSGMDRVSAKPVSRAPMIDSIPTSAAIQQTPSRVAQVNKQSSNPSLEAQSENHSAMRRSTVITSSVKPTRDPSRPAQNCQPTSPLAPDTMPSTSSANMSVISVAPRTVVTAGVLTIPSRLAIGYATRV